MGQALSSETMSISGGDGYRYWVGLKMKPLGSGCKKTVFKGVLLGSGPRQWEKVVAKAFTDIPGTKAIWAHEVNKADLTRQLAASFLREFRRMCKISVVIPGIVQMDKVSNANKWLASKNGTRGLDRDEWISVEEFINGQMHRYCPWSDEHTDDVRESVHLNTFSHFTYKHSRGALVACDFQGTCTCDSSSGSIPQYVFTDSIIHSTHSIYGKFDMGEVGITEYFKHHKCNEICRDWPKPTPMTPPPPFEEACALQLHLTPPPAFENIIFQSQQALPPEEDEQEANVSETNLRRGRRRHASAHAPRTDRHVRERGGSNNFLSVDGDVPRRRRSLSNLTRNNTLGAPRECIPQTPSPSAPGPSPSLNCLPAPPSYESLIPHADMRRRSSSFGGIIESDYIDSRPSNDFHVTNIEAEGTSATRMPNIPRSGSANPHHQSLAITFSDPACNLLDHQSLAATQSENNLRRDRSRSTGSSSSLRRRRMLNMQIQQTYGDRAPDMVDFYLGELEAELPPLRVTPSAPPADEIFTPNG